MHRAYFVAANFLRKDWGTDIKFTIFDDVLKEAQELSTGSTPIDESKLLNLSKKFD